MTAALGDILNQGKYAIYVSNISEDGVLIQGNNLWVPRKALPAMICNTTIWRALWASKWAAGAWGMQFGDLNNDGTSGHLPDNGYVSADQEQEATGTTFQKLPAATARSSAMPRIGRRWKAELVGLPAEARMDERWSG